MMGRLVEISGHRAAANLTVAFGLVLEAQRREETAVWVTLKQSTFFPPDVAASGISLAHLAVVRVDDARAATRATVELTRSGGFDLVVLDLGPEAIREKLVRRDKRRGWPTVPFDAASHQARRHRAQERDRRRRAHRENRSDELGQLSHLTACRSPPRQRRTTRCRGGGLEGQAPGTRPSLPRGLSCPGWLALTSPPSLFSSS